MLFPLLRCWLCAVLVGPLDRGVQGVLDHGRVLPVDDCDDPVQRRPHEVVPVVIKGDRLGLGLLAGLDDVERLAQLAPEHGGDFLATLTLQRSGDRRGPEQVEGRERSLLRRHLGGIEQFLVVPALEHHERNYLPHEILPSSRTRWAARPRPLPPCARIASRIPLPACRTTLPRRWRQGGPQATRRRRGTGSWLSGRWQSV